MLSASQKKLHAKSAIVASVAMFVASSLDVMNLNVHAKIVRYTIQTPGQVEGHARLGKHLPGYYCFCYCCCCCFCYYCCCCCYCCCFVRLFEDFNPKVKTKSSADQDLDWPVEFPVGPPPAELDGDVLSLRCGTADCKFRVHCYRCFEDPNAEEKELLESSEEESSSEEEEEEEEEGGDSGKIVGEVKKDISSKMSGLEASGGTGLLPKVSNVGAGVVVVEMEGGKGGKMGERRGGEAEGKGDEGEEEEEEETGGDRQNLV